MEGIKWNGNMVIESLICEVCTIRCHYDMYLFKIIHLQCVTHSCDSKCEICTVTQGFVDILMVYQSR